MVPVLNILICFYCIKYPDNVLLIPVGNIYCTVHVSVNSCIGYPYLCLLMPVLNIGVFVCCANSTNLALSIYSGRNYLCLFLLLKGREYLYMSVLLPLGNTVSSPVSAHPGREYLYLFSAASVREHLYLSLLLPFVNIYTCICSFQVRVSTVCLSLLLLVEVSLYISAVSCRAYLYLYLAFQSGTYLSVSAVSVREYLQCPRLC